LTPEVTPLPPRSAEEPKLRDVRQFYVKPYDLDPADGGIGYTDGCKGCKAIVYGTARTGHANHCRHRVIKTAATNADVAARVRHAINRDVEYHAKKLETNEANRRKPELEATSEERKTKQPRKEEEAAGANVPFEENEPHTPGSSSQAPSGSKVKTKFETKKREVRIRVGMPMGPYLTASHRHLWILPRRLRWSR